MSQSPITMDTEREGDPEDRFQEFRMQVDSDDGLVDEFWVIRLEITDPEMFEFVAQTFWSDPDGGEFEAYPLDIRIRDEIDTLTERAVEEFLGFTSPADHWADAGVSQADFI